MVAPESISWCIGVDGVRGNSQAHLFNGCSEQGKGFVLLLEKGAYGESSILNDDLKGLLDHISRKPSKHGYECLVVGGLLVNLMGMRLILGGQDIQGRILRRCRWMGEVEQLSVVCVKHDAGINDMLGGVPTV